MTSACAKLPLTAAEDFREIVMAILELRSNVAYRSRGSAPRSWITTAKAKPPLELLQGKPENGFTDAALL